jgi:hypothetical protein
MVDLWCESHRRPPKSITPDIDDTADTVHGHQQLSPFNAHDDERCFPPINICDADSRHCVLTIPRSGKTPDGKQVRAHLRRLIRRIRLHWPRTRITVRGDCHYGRKAAMEWCDANGVNRIFGPGPNKILAERICPKLDECCVRRATGRLDLVRDFTETRHAAKSWSHSRRVVARIEATRKGADVRLDPLRGSSVTNLKKGSAKHRYETVCCAQGQAENRSNGTKANWRQTGPVAARLSPTRCV